MNNITKLYDILFLNRTERIAKLKKILSKLTNEEIMFISLLITIRTEGNFIVKKPSIFIEEKSYALLLFMYHIVAQDNLISALQYLPKKEYTVTVSILRGNELPLVEILEHIEKVYSMVDITKYVRSKINVPIRQEVVANPLSFIIKGDSRLWTTYDTLSKNDIPSNIIILNNNQYTYSRTFKDYLLHKGTNFPKELLTLPQKEHRNIEGKYLISYTLKGYSTEFIDYLKTTCKVVDWLIDDTYEIVGVKYLFKDKEYSLKVHIKEKSLDSLSVLVHHTKRNKIVEAELVSLT